MHFLLLSQQDSARIRLTKQTESRIKRKIKWKLAAESIGQPREAEKQHRM